VFNLQTTIIFDGQGQTAMCHSSEDMLLPHMDKETKDKEIRYIVRVRTPTPFYIEMIV
jgi:hypothetical protein